MQRTVSILFSLTSLLVTVACSPAQEAPPASEPVLATAIAESESATMQPVSSGPTVKSLMTEWVDPNASALWGAVSYVITEEGVTETLPENDADWAALRANADALVEAGELLKQPGLRVDAPGAVYPDFQFSPEEIEQLIALEPEAWASYAEDMQRLTLQTSMAIDLQDLNGLTDFGARINQACEGCHAVFWYRPLGPGI